MAKKVTCKKVQFDGQLPVADVLNRIYVGINLSFASEVEPHQHNDFWPYTLLKNANRTWSASRHIFDGAKARLLKLIKITVFCPLRRGFTAVPPTDMV